MKKRRAWLSAAVAQVEHWLLPPVCVLCGAAGETAGLDLCAACRADLPANRPACERCAEPLGTTAPWVPLCGHCIAAPPPWDRAFSAFRYARPVDSLLTGLKFHGRLANGRVLGTCL
ncbi:MAG: double zinc ribbon domain-containing protein, partial [Pseudomonadota bacterium]